MSSPKKDLSVSISRDLLMLASVAFKTKNYKEAGELFAASMSSGDTEELLQYLDSEYEPEIKPAIEASEDDGIAASWKFITIDELKEAATRASSLKNISEQLSESMSMVPDFSAFASDLDLSEDQESTDENDDSSLDLFGGSDVEDENYTESDDYSAAPGEKIYPSSLSVGMKIEDDEIESVSADIESFTLVPSSLNLKSGISVVSKETVSTTINRA